MDMPASDDFCLAETGHKADVAFPVNFYELVPFLLNENPRWTEQDVTDLVEEKTRQRIHPEDLTTLRAVYWRCVRLEKEFLPVD